MSLAQAYFLLAAILVVPGLMLPVPAGVRALSAFPRSKVAGYVFFGAAAAWFLYGLSRMSEAELAGIPQPLMLGLFGAAAVAAFYYLTDLLAVRGVAGLALLVSVPLLEAGFGRLPRSLPLSVVTYGVLILPALCYGTAPYLLREWIVSVTKTGGRARAAGLAFLVVAAVCAVSGFLTPAV